MAYAAIIPARYGSTRFPGKPLASIAGHPMIEHVWRRASQARSVDEVWVATDDERIASVVRGFGGGVVMTSSEARSGTDRIAEALETVEAEVVVNVQGDEPLVDPAAIDLLAGALRSDPGLDVATLAAPISDPGDLARPDVVKVVSDRRGRALYFSRSPIPHGAAPGSGLAFRHLGLYAYRRAALEAFVGWGPSPLELSERLEQLRFLDHGVAVRVLPVRAAPHAVDRPQDVAAVERALEAAEAAT